MTPQIKQRIAQIQKGEVPTGYKKTDVGIVPQEWKSCLLGDLLSFKNGINAEKSKFGSGIKLISVLDILHGNPIHYNDIYNAIDIDNNTLSKYDVTYGDILFQRSSETFEDAGKSNVYIDKQHVATYSGFVIRGKKKAHYNPIYLNELLKIAYIRKQVIKLSAGSQHINISQDVLGSIKIVLSTENEQNRIAEILLTQDKHIELQEKLITQKQEQKKYLMQVLLTGKQRLKGFSGEWESKKLGDICRIQDGYPLKSSSYSTSKKEIQVVRISDINSKNKNNDKVFIEQNQIVIDNLNSYLVNKGDLLLSLTGAAGFNFFIWESGKAILNQRTVKFIFEGSNKNMCYLLEGMLHQYLNEKGTGQNNNLSKDDLVKSKIELPSPLEQGAIAKILIAADKKIELLKKQLEHEKQRKKSLMQLLLTGIVRV